MKSSEIKQKVRLKLMKNRLNMDYSLLSILILLGLISILTLYIIEPTLPPKFEGIHFWLQQAKWYVGGGVVITAVMLIDYDRFHQITWILYGIGMLSLVMLFFGFPPGIVPEVKGSVAWFQIPLIGTVQPSEFMKVILVMVLAHIIVRHKQKYSEKTIKIDLLLLSKIAAVAAPPMLLIAVQPDLGTFLVLGAITASLVLVSGIQWRILFAMLLMVVIAGLLGLVAWQLFPDAASVFIDITGFDHVAGRITGWLNPNENPDDSYQFIKGMLAIGSGQLFGKGVSSMEVNVPEQHTDMIFTAIAEQFGFIGSSIVITLFFLLIYRLVYIALQSNDRYGTYLVTGMIGMFAYQIFQNIGMSIQLLPITGLPLPFLSYGGSSTLTYLLAIGIVLNVHSRTKKYMFEEARWYD
ncbi:rod shape-determining protein RodA [Lentibacillus cibarius]|uniref:Rod shape-determining protein RodA n=2 Tax=Lentibacillus cibarius TaxID=2583219 RepID=A0A549YJ82_9BACI|nr:rod shape-determining protein RodA [Lentibacillus cibarius]